VPPDASNASRNAREMDYAGIYLRDQAERLKTNFAAWEGRSCLVTLTAPGAKTLSWDSSKCPPGPHTCSGRLGCRVQWVQAAGWNATVTKRLGDLLKAAREQTRCSPRHRRSRYSSEDCAPIR
jgi:hypothetical protein